jgi:DNA-binding Lrp family transcriptional regulator
MRIILCDDAHKLLDDFLCSALASWSSGRIADVLGCSEAALLYRAYKLEDAMLEAEAIYKPRWKQLSLDDCIP